MSDDAPRGNPGVDPDDLDISKSEYVRELGDDRYVVSAGNRPPRSPREGDAPDDPSGERPDGTAVGGADPSDPDAAAVAESVREGLSPDDGPGATPTARGDATPDARDDATTPGSAPAADDSADVTSAAGAASPAAGTGGRPEGADPTGPAGSDDGLPGDPTDGAAGGSRDPATGDRPASHERRGAPRGGGDTGGSPDDIDAGAVGQWLAASLADSEFAYGFDATLSLDGRTARHRMASDDVGETFETLVTWFAGAAGGDTPTEDALGILIAGMDTGPRLPPNAVRSALSNLGLSRDDSVEDLLAALDRAGGLRLE
ncbi:DUF7500 family protein [Halobaculum sp. EA56]|uniref:DUF7500 family protein n=1 Tax=Halobaculum sp. EA56 TaxID=3421648 RepID=UPI003EB80D1B